MRAREFLKEAPYDNVPSERVPSWMKALGSVFTGGRQTYKDSMAISQVVQVLKKEDPKKYGLSKWTSKSLIDTAKDMLRKGITPGLDLKKKSPKPTPKPTPTPTPKPRIKIKPKTTPTPTPKPEPTPTKKKSSLPSTLAPISTVEPGATMTVGKKKITFDGTVWTDQSGQKYGQNPKSLEQLNQAYLGYENANRAAEVQKIKLKAYQNVSGNR